METRTQLKSVIFTMDIFAVQYGIVCITSVARRCVCTLFLLLEDVYVLRFFLPLGILYQRKKVSKFQNYLEKNI